MDVAKYLKGRPIGPPLLLSTIVRSVATYCRLLHDHLGDVKPAAWAKTRTSLPLQAFRAPLHWSFATLRVDFAACSKDFPVFSSVPVNV